MADALTIVALNCGSSSLKYAAFRSDEVIARGEIDQIGSGGIADHATAVHAALDELDRRGTPRATAVGHRIVHGGPHHLEPALVDRALLIALEAATPFAPLHLPIELAAVAAVKARFADVPQVACFDTSFHRSLPEAARRFALPTSLFEDGVRRYGFHGLSYEFIAGALPRENQRRAVFAHLGSGASMVAIRDGRSVDTTMGLTPTGGLVMATRAGDLDPGVMLYLLRRGYDASSLAKLVDRDAGLLAISETTADMQQLIALRAIDTRAALAIDVFCHHAKKAIGAFAAVLGGIESLVFTGGIGQHAPQVREAICADLEHLGIELDADRNRANATLINRGGCEVHVIATDEERMVARHTRRLVGDAPP